MVIRWCGVVVIAGLLSLPLGAAAQAEAEAEAEAEVTPPEPGQLGSSPLAVTAEDTPNDKGGSITISWEPGEPGGVDEWIVFAATDPAAADWQLVGQASAQSTEIAFNTAESGRDYWFTVGAVTLEGTVYSEVVGPAAARAQWFNSDKLPIFFLGALICAFIIFFIRHARRGGELFIRKIAGLEAIDEAIGRSTEMGRPIVFVPGIMDMDNVQTLAGLTLLGHVSKMVAEYDTEINVPVSRSLVMTAGREVVQQAYLEAGRPDAYNENIVHYLTDDQFGYVAGVNGIIVRDEPATCFYQGAFYAESLILAETGNSAGAIQIAGTAMPSQLPFFVAACDYTLIGEELFAASAYLSGDPQQLGSLKGQDVGKLIAMVAIALGALAATLMAVVGPESGVGEAMEWVLERIRGVFV